MKLWNHKKSTGSLVAISCLISAVSFILFISASAKTALPEKSSFSLYLPLAMNETETQTPPPSASWGMPIAVSPLDGNVWVVNPDAGSVTVVDPIQQQKVAEIVVGQEPWSLVISPDGRTIYILDRAAGSLVTIDGLTRQIESSLPLGAEPGQIGLTPDGHHAYITLTTAAEVMVVDTTQMAISALIPVAAHPYAIAISGEKVYVTHLQAFPRVGGEEARDDGRESKITVLDAATHTVQTEISLPPDNNGFPNLLTSLTIRGNQAWVPHVRAAPDFPRSLTSTVFAAVSVLDLSSNQEDAAAHLPLNDQEIFGSPVNNPVTAVPSPDGKTLYIVLAGSNLVEVVDISVPSQPQLVTFLAVGQNPRGLALSRDGRYAYVMNYLSRSLTILNLETLTSVAEIPVTAETLPADVLRGKILFNNATDPRLSQGSWISCASCHPDGGTDGVTWMFPDGPRQTPPLWNSQQTLPWHWSAALDEAQDVEDTVQHIQHGLGLAPGVDPELLGWPNHGRSSDLDALAAFMAQGIRTPNLPSAPDTAAGRQLFQAAGCAGCHGGPTWTSSQLPGPPGTLDPDGNGMVDEVLRDVGTLNPRDIRGSSGFDPPFLLNVRLTAPYLHDGSMPTLTALLASGHPDPAGQGNGLSATEIETLVLFLGTIGAETAPVESLD